MVLIRDAIKSVLKYLSKTNAGDTDRRWSVHYTTHKPLHGLLFLPTTTRGSPDQTSPLQVLSLNQQNDCSSAGPAPFPSSARLDQSDRRRGFDWRHRSRKLSSVDSDDDEQLVVGGTRPLTPLVLTSCWEGGTSCVEGGTSCEGLPTPEERTRRQAQTVIADIVPINVSGESFDRQASLNRRPNLQRRKTITGTPQDFSTDLVRPDPVQFSTVDRPSSVHNPHKTSNLDQRNQTEPRRIRAPRGDLSSLMRSLTSPKHLEPQEVPRSTSCAQTETGSDYAPYRTLCYTPSDCQSEVRSLSSSSVSSQLQDEPWSYQPLSPSCSLHSAQDSGSVCGEAWNCDPLLFSGPSSPSHTPLFSDVTGCSSSLLLDDNTTHYNSQTSLYLEENTSDSSHIPDKMAAPSSLKSKQTSHISSPSYNSLNSETTSNFSSKLDKNSSYSQSSLCSSSSLKLDKRSSFSSGSSLCRSISLRKSKRPPAPPTRTDSLRRKPNRQKSDRSTLSPRLEKKKALGSSPQTFYDPWVPRSNAKRRQSGLNCGTVTTFEPLQLEPKEEELYEEILPTTPNHSQVSSENGLQRLASPSSGYSSQSNTPTAGTPLLSPVSPSSPLPESSEIPASPNAPKCNTASFPRKKSNRKPKPPERKSSLFSSLSSSFSSTSSLSSYTSSSDSSAKHLPPLPLTPPLPVSNQQLPVYSYQICNSNVPSSNVVQCPSNSSCTDPIISKPLPPPPPPPPVFNQQLPVCHLPNDKPTSKSSFSNPDSAVLTCTNPTVSMPLAQPPSPPSLPPRLSLPSPPPLPVFNQELPVCSPQICQSPSVVPFFQNPSASIASSVSLSSSTASLPPPPPLPPRLSLPTPPPLPATTQELPVLCCTIRDSPPSPPSPPPLPPISSRPSPPPYSQAFKQSSFPHSSVVSSSKPPPSPSSPTHSTSKPTICKSPKTSKPVSPLVTTQALQNIKLRSVKNQEILRTNSMPSMETAHTKDANTSLAKLRNKPHANSSTFLNESPGRQVKLNPIKCGIIEPRDGVSCTNQQSFAQKAEQDSNRQVSSPTSTDANGNKAVYKSTDEANADLIISQPNYSPPGVEANTKKAGFMFSDEANTPLTATEANYNQKTVEINKISDNLSGANLKQNERFEEAFEDTNKAETAQTNVCSSDSSVHLRANQNHQDNYNQTECDISKQKDALIHAKPSRQPCLGETINVQEDSELCGELKSEDSYQSSKETDLDKGRLNSEEVCDNEARVESNNDKYDLQKSAKMPKPSNYLPCANLWSRQGSYQEDLETHASTRNAQISRKELLLNENDQVEIDKKLAVAEVRSNDFNIQNALISKVDQYELKTSQTYFQTCDNIPNPLENFGKRHKAYLDMYAMLADSTVLNQATEVGKLNSVLMENSNSGPQKLSTHVRSKKTQSKVNYSHYDMMGQDISEFRDSKSQHVFVQPKKQGGLGQSPEDKEKTQKGLNVYEKSRVTSPESPWVKISHNNDDNNLAVQHQQVTKAEESQYWTLSGENYKTEPQKEDIVVMANVQDPDSSPGNLKEAPSEHEQYSSRKPRSPVKPVLPKKPDLGILGLLKSPKRTASVEKTTPDKAQIAPTAPSNSPRRQKPPILHKKPDLSILSSPKSSPSRFPSNDAEQVWSTRTVEDCGASRIWTTRNSENDNSFTSTIQGSTTMKICATSTILSNNLMENCEKTSTMQKSGAPTIGSMDHGDNENLDASTELGTSAFDYYDNVRIWSSSTMQTNTDLGKYSNKTQENCGNSVTSAVRGHGCSGNESRLWSTLGHNATRTCNSENCGQIWSPGTCINPEKLAVSVPSTMERQGHSLFRETNVKEGSVPSRMCSNSAINKNSNTRAKDDADDSANWIDNLENFGSKNIENSSDNIWCPRNMDNLSYSMKNCIASRVFSNITRENCGNMTAAPTIKVNTVENGLRNYSQQTAIIPSQIESMQVQQSHSGMNSTERRVMRSSLAEDEEECVTENVEKMGTTVIVMPNKKTRKRRKRRANKQHLMKKMEHSSSSSSTSSSENEFEKSLSQRLGLMRVGSGDSTNSDGSCDGIGQSRFSFSSELSTDSLKGELSLPDLLIQEPDEQDERGRRGEVEKTEEKDMFVSVSADQVTVPGQTRTTDDLFAIIHRSKRKMFGRKDSENYRSSSSSSSSSPPLTPTDFQPQLKGQSSSKSDSFKALLLKKGGQLTSTSRLSAVERLCGVRPHLQKTEPEELSFRWVSTSCVFVSTSCLKQRPLTPLSSVSRRFAARSSFCVTPMASILENEEEEEEEEEDDEVFVFD